MGWCFDADVFVAYGEEIEFEETDAADLLFKMLLHKTEEQETMDKERKRRKDVANAGLLTRSGQLPLSLTGVIVGAATAATEAAKPDAQDQEITVTTTVGDDDDDSSRSTTPDFGPEPPDGGWWLTDRAREAFKKLVEITGGYVCDPEHHFDLVWNYQDIWAEVFDIFAERVLGEEHGLALRVMTSMTPFLPADTYILIHDKTMQVRHEGSAEGGRGDITGVPPGVRFARIPTGANTSASDAKFAALSEALPFSISPSWLLVTYYSSG